MEVSQQNESYQSPCMFYTNKDESTDLWLGTFIQVSHQIYKAEKIINYEKIIQYPGQMEKIMSIDE